MTVMRERADFKAKAKSLNADMTVAMRERADLKATENRLNAATNENS